MEEYNYDSLSKIVGEKVSVSDEQGNEVFLTLSHIHKNAIDGEKWEAFSAVYDGEEEFRIAQGNYTFKHKCFGEKMLFLTPNSTTEYETVITRERKIPEELTA